MVALEAYHGDRAALGTAEQWCLAMGGVPHFRRRADLLAFNLSFPAVLSEVSEEVNRVTAACRNARASPELERLLAVVLTVGNCLNRSGRMH